MTTSTLYSNALGTNNDGNNGFTLVCKFAASEFTIPAGSITQLRFTFKAGSTQAFTITNAYAQYQAGAGDAYDFSATPSQILFSGSGSGTVSSGGTLASDFLTFAYDKSTTLLIALYCAGGTGSDMTSVATGVTGHQDYFKNANDAATVNKTGYSAYSAGWQIAITAVEATVLDSGGFFSMF